MVTITLYKIRSDGVFDGNFEFKTSNFATFAIPPGYTDISPHPIPNNHYAFMLNRWVYIEGETPPPPQPIVIIHPITMRQARLELLSVGKLNDVDIALASIPDDQQRKAAQIEWEYAAIVERQAPLVKALTPALGFTEEEMDDLFKRAALL